MTAERPSTAARGYGSRHQALRRALLASYAPSDPCPRCGRPLGSNPDALDLGHVDGDRSRYSGLEHARCNRATAGRAAGPRSPEGRPLTPIEPDSQYYTDDLGNLYWCGMSGVCTPVAEAW